MIGYLKGTLIYKQMPFILLDVQGVGYELEVSFNTFNALPECQQLAVLYTHLIVREDAQLFICFHNLLERELFRVLIKMSGVGPKSALNILSHTDPHTFIQIISTQDTHRLSQVPGIGKKMAARLVIELRDKLNLDLPAVNFEMSPTQQNTQDAINALVTLGYKSSHAARIISRVYQEHLSSEDLIRLALKEIAEEKT